MLPPSPFPRPSLPITYDVTSPRTCPRRRSFFSSRSVDDLSLASVSGHYQDDLFSPIAFLPPSLPPFLCWLSFLLFFFFDSVTYFMNYFLSSHILLIYLFHVFYTCLLQLFVCFLLFYSISLLSPLHLIYLSIALIHPPPFLQQPSIRLIAVTVHASARRPSARVGC